MPPIKCLTDAQLNVLIAQATPRCTGPPKLFDKYRNLLLILLMADAGLRVSEALHLKYHDLYAPIPGAPIADEIPHQPTRNLLIRAEIAKNAKSRIVPLSDRLRGVLLLRHPRSLHDLHRFTSSYVFLSRHDHLPISRRTVQYALQHISKACLPIAVNPHMLRHTFATRLMRTTDIRTVQALLGHTSLTSTQIYTHPDSTDLDKAIQSLNTGDTHNGTQ